jgi:hypothetical protein
LLATIVVLVSMNSLVVTNTPGAIWDRTGTWPSVGKTGGMGALERLAACAGLTAAQVNDAVAAALATVATHGIFAVTTILLVLAAIGFG